LDDDGREEEDPSSAPHIYQSDPQRVLKRKRSFSPPAQDSEASNYELPELDFGLSAVLRKRQRRRSLSPLARVQRLPTGQRILRPTNIPSRAATPDEADQAFIQSDEEGLGMDNQRSSDSLSRSSTPLSDPPEYINGMSSPGLNFRIYRQEGDALCWSRWDKEGFGD